MGLMQARLSERFKCRLDCGRVGALKSPSYNRHKPTPPSAPPWRWLQATIFPCVVGTLRGLRIALHKDTDGSSRGTPWASRHGQTWTQAPPAGGCATPLWLCPPWDHSLPQGQSEKTEGAQTPGPTAPLSLHGLWCLWKSPDFPKSQSRGSPTSWSLCPAGSTPLSSPRAGCRKWGGESPAVQTRTGTSPLSGLPRGGQTGDLELSPGVCRCDRHLGVR